MRIGEIASIAQALEPIITPKPGNIHRLRDIPRTGLAHILESSIISLKYYVEAANIGLRYYLTNSYVQGSIGEIVYSCVRDIVERVGQNTSLGTILNLTLQSAATTYTILKFGRFNVEKMVEAAYRIARLTDVLDATFYLKAVRTAGPSYLGRLSYWGIPDVNDPLLEVKILENHTTLYELLETLPSDLVSKNFISGLQLTRNYYKLSKELLESYSLNCSLIKTYAQIILDNGDYLVFRKHGIEGLNNMTNWLGECLEYSEERELLECMEVVDLRFRSKKYNPGSTADIIATIIMCYLLESKPMEVLEGLLYNPHPS